MEQSFSVKNFRNIYDIDIQNRGDLERVHFVEAYNKHVKFRSLKKFKFRMNLKAKNNSENNLSSYYEERLSLINKLLKIRREDYNCCVNDALKEICLQVNKKGYKLTLERLPNQVSGKDVFTIGRTVESIFVTRHLNNILKSVYKIKQSHRDLIVSRVKGLCLDQSPKYIIKADISDFYESVEHDAIIKKLHSSTHLSVLPKRILTQLLKSYANLVGLDKGLPRGVGLSAYLSELYMLGLDDELVNSSDLTFYSRYVDDLFLIYSPNAIKSKNEYLQHVTKAIEDYNLKLNKKTKEIDLTFDKKQEFEYLGYRFIFSSSNVTIQLSCKRVMRYKGRIDQAIHSYLKKYKYNPKQKANLLINKMRFLTGNTRLLNAKSKAFTGIYFNNMHINCTADLVKIDQYFNKKLQEIEDERLRRRLYKFSFVEGFEKKVFRSFTTTELKNITRGWKDV